MKGRILVVDNEAAIRRSLSAGLQQEGFTVVACPDGISAIHELSAARRQGAGFDGLVIDIFLPGIDGMTILKGVRNLFPGLPVLMITGFGDEKLKQAVLSEPNTAYLDKPFGIREVVRAMGALSPAPAHPEARAESAGEARAAPESTRAYLAIRIAEPDRSLAILTELDGMPGVRSCDAVHGDVDIILRVEAASREDMDALLGRVRSVRGVQVVSTSPAEHPRLDPDVDQFIRTCRRGAGPAAPAQAEKHPGAASYLIVDIDRDALQPVFAAVSLLDEVVFCDVIEQGAKLIGMIAAAEAGGEVRKAIERLSHIDGVLRVREARIIRMIDT